MDTHYIFTVANTLICLRRQHGPGTEFSLTVRRCKFWDVFFHSMYDLCVRCYINFPPGGGSLPVGIESGPWSGMLGWELDSGGSTQQLIVIQSHIFYLWLLTTKGTCECCSCPLKYEKKKKVSEGPWVRWLIRLTLNFQYTRIEIIVPEVKLYNRNNVASW